MVRRTQNGRLAEREDVSDLISFLASPNSRHINGQNIVVDGGWSKNFWWGDVSIPR
jgi:NAD(P)-dependent dehydrogenase (short-subunit alcohol dehydrogenase family)